MLGPLARSPGRLSGAQGVLPRGLVVTGGRVMLRRVGRSLQPAGEVRVKITRALGAEGRLDGRAHELVPQRDPLPLYDRQSRLDGLGGALSEPLERHGSPMQRQPAQCRPGGGRLAFDARLDHPPQPLVVSQLRELFQEATRTWPRGRPQRAH